MSKYGYSYSDYMLNWKLWRDISKYKYSDNSAEKNILSRWGWSTEGPLIQEVICVAQGVIDE